MSADRLDYLNNTDLAVLESALTVLEQQGDLHQIADIYRLREKLERMGVANLVPWGIELTNHLMKQVDLLAAGKRDLDDFIREIDIGYLHGRNSDRDSFLNAIKDLARKITSEMEQKGRKA